MYSRRSHGETEGAVVHPKIILPPSPPQKKQFYVEVTSDYILQ